MQVKAVPEDMEYYGKGPLLSAKDLDLDVLWKRADQIKLVCDEVIIFPALMKLPCTVSA